METKTVTARELKNLILTRIPPFGVYPCVWIWVGFGGVRGAYVFDSNGDMDGRVFGIISEVGPKTPIVIHTQGRAIFVGGECPTYEMDEEGEPTPHEVKLVHVDSEVK